ncbi:hypothetical protein ACDX78_04110 [Virgibacillus oceani]
MKILWRKIVPLVMILLAIIPALVIYEPLSQIFPVFSNYTAPDWFIPVGFINIGFIVVLSILVKGKDD